MSTRVRLVLALSGAALVLGFGVQAATANRLGMTTERLRIVWASLRFQGSTGIEVVCPVTIEAWLIESIWVKQTATRIGWIETIRTGTCTGGTITFLYRSSSSNLRWWSWEGTLPEGIRRVLIYNADIGIHLRDTLFGMPVECLYLATEEGSVSLYFNRETRGRITEVTPPPLGETENRIFYNSGSGEAACGSRISAGGTGTEGRITVSGSATGVTLVLV